MATLSAATNIPMADKTPSQPRMSRKRFRQPSESAEDEDAPGHLSTKKYRVFTLAGAGSLVRSTVERATSSVSLALRRQERLKEGSSKYESEHSSLPSSGLSLDKEVSSKEVSSPSSRVDHSQLPHSRLAARKNSPTCGLHPSLLWTRVANGATTPPPSVPHSTRDTQTRIETLLLRLLLDG